MNQSEAEQLYLYHDKRTKEQIDGLGNNPQAINAFITNTYAILSQENPSFLWFSLGAIISETVGRNIKVATQTIINSASQEPSSKIVLEAFSKGNQDIFKSVLTIFLTYKSIGMEGIKLLSTDSDIEDNPFENSEVFNALEKYSLLEAQQSSIASSQGLDLNDPKVIDTLFSDKKNIKISHDVAMGIAAQEQDIVQKMYIDEFVEIIQDPALGWVGGQLKLDEINLLGKSYKFSDYIVNPEDFDQRLVFAEILLNAIEEGIVNGQFEAHQGGVLQMAEHALWMSNPNASHNTLGGTNGAYWGQQAEVYDQKVKDMVLAYLHPDQLVEETTIANPIENIVDNAFASIFSGENEIVKINMDPLALFLANNPNYEVIAHDFAELWASTNYFRTPIWGGTALWNPELPYLKNSTYLAIYDFGEYRYYQPYGEVRGITFPFIYDKTTGTPLTMPIKDAAGHYDHVSTIDMIYNNPEAFNQPSHINWYNPYWNSLVQQAQQTAINHYFKSITVDSFMNNILAPTSSNISYYNSNLQIELKGSDILHNEFDNIDFSSLKGLGQGNGSAIVSMVLANGTTFEVDKSGNFVCINCSSGDSVILEQAANAFLHQII